MPQGVHSRMDFAAFAALMAIVSGPTAALRGRLDRLGIIDNGAWLSVTSFRQPQENTQVMNHGLEHAGAQPALGLLVDRVPGRKIGGHHPPLSTGSHDPAQAVEDFA